MDLYSAAAWLLYASAALVVAAVTTRLRRALRKRTVVAFLHPYAAQGGGGERVLWVAIAALRRARPDVRIVVYSGDGLSAAELASHARERFGVAVPADLAVQPVASRRLTHAKTWPVATMAGQALGAVVLAAESVMRLPPDVLVDTTGLAYCFPLVRAAGVRHLACYVHYPIVQSDMLGAVASRQAAHNNAAFFARSAARSALKLAYYRLLLCCYAHAGSHAPSWWHHSSPPWISRLLAALSASKLGRWATEPRRAHWEAAVRP